MFIDQGQTETTQEGFEDDLIIALDKTPYFQASAVTDLAARHDLAFITVPPYSAELTLSKSAGDSYNRLSAIAFQID